MGVGGGRGAGAGGVGDERAGEAGKCRIGRSRLGALRPGPPPRPHQIRFLPAARPAALRARVALARVAAAGALRQWAERAADRGHRTPVDRSRPARQRPVQRVPGLRPGRRGAADAVGGLLGGADASQLRARCRRPFHKDNQARATSSRRARQTRPRPRPPDRTPSPSHVQVPCRAMPARRSSPPRLEPRRPAAC